MRTTSAQHDIDETDTIVVRSVQGGEAVRVDVTGNGSGLTFWLTDQSARELHAELTRALRLRVIPGGAA